MQVIHFKSLKTILLCLNGRLHAYANWATNVHHADSFIQRMSRVTIMYNHFGEKEFKRIMFYFYRLGAVRNSYRDISKVFAHNLHSKVMTHVRSTLVHIQAFSRLATFALAFRGQFMEIYRKYSPQFHAINPEALFVGVVLHSIDRGLFESHISDPLLFSSQDAPEFGHLYDISRAVRCGFTSDLPGLLFSHKCKDAPHGLFQDIYKVAKEIDTSFADMLD
jgi:hypothetical protein